MSHRPFADLRAAIDADPDRRARVASYHRAIRDALALADARLARGEQPERPGNLGHPDEPYLAALGGYVAALGGHLELSAVFPDGTTLLVGRYGEPDAALAENESMEPTELATAGS